MKKCRPYRWYPYPQSEIAKAKRRERQPTGLTIDIDSIVLSIDEEFHWNMLNEINMRKGRRASKEHPARRRRKHTELEIRPVIRVIEPRNMYGKRKTKGK